MKTWAPWWWQQQNPYFDADNDVSVESQNSNGFECFFVVFSRSFIECVCVCIWNGHARFACTFIICICKQTEPNTIEFLLTAGKMFFISLSLSLSVSLPRLLFLWIVKRLPFSIAHCSLSAWIDLLWLFCDAFKM